MSGVGSSPTRGTCETSQVLLARVPDGFSSGAPGTDKKPSLSTQKEASQYQIGNIQLGNDSYSPKGIQSGNMGMYYIAITETIAKSCPCNILIFLSC